MAEAPEEFVHDVCHRIRAHALSLPQTTEGTSCVNRAFKAGSKNFVFLGEKGSTCTVRLKLDSGWTKLEFDAEEPPSDDELKAMIEESFLLLAPKKIAALLGAD